MSNDETDPASLEFPVGDELTDSLPSSPSDEKPRELLRTNTNRPQPDTLDTSPAPLKKPQRPIRVNTNRPRPRPRPEPLPPPSPLEPPIRVNTNRPMVEPPPELIDPEVAEFNTNVGRPLGDEILKDEILKERLESDD